MTKEQEIMQYLTENAITFYKHLKTEGLTCFEDIMEDFRDRFNDSWLRK